jgi:hypothetical protein
MRKFLFKSGIGIGLALLSSAALAATDEKLLTTSFRPNTNVCAHRSSIAPHLRKILTAYAFYYNQSRTLSLHKDAPLGRAIQRYGTIAATPVMSGLHHRYLRI